MKTAKKVACYIRVSTEEQNEAGQRAELEKWLAGHGIALDGVTWYLDKMSGDNMNRPAFKELQKAVFNGEVGTVVVWKVDRFSRSLQDGMNIICDWLTQGIRFVSTTQQFDYNGTLGQIILNFILGMGQMEQDTRRERQAAGIAIAKKRGKYKGRKVGTTKGDPDRAIALREKGYKVKEIAEALGVSTHTIFVYLRTGKKYPKYHHFKAQS